MAVPAHKTEYFIIENSNLQKKANTPQTMGIFLTFLNVTADILPENTEKFAGDCIQALKQTN